MNLLSPTQIGDLARLYEQLEPLKRNKINDSVGAMCKAQVSKPFLNIQQTIRVHTTRLKLIPQIRIEKVYTLFADPIHKLAKEVKAEVLEELLEQYRTKGSTYVV